MSDLEQNCVVLLDRLITRDLPTVHLRLVVNSRVLYSPIDSFSNWGRSSLSSNCFAMGPSLRDHSSFVRPVTRDQPLTRDQGDTSLVIPSRTSSLHSRITQPISSTLNTKPAHRTPKTLTHAYMVCGVGREPSQWVKAPVPCQGKIGHMKGAVGQFWLPEILGSSPRLEQDNDVARALHAAMRVSPLAGSGGCCLSIMTRC